MIQLDDLGATLGGGADYGPDAVARLQQRLAAERSPRDRARRKTWTGSLVFALTAVLGGAAVGALAEVRETPPAAAFLPAGAGHTPVGLLFGEG